MSTRPSRWPCLPPRPACAASCSSPAPRPWGRPQTPWWTRPRRADPTSPYEVTKRLAEEGLLELGARTGLEVVIVRPCLIAGEGQRGGVLLKLFKLCRKGLFPVFGGPTATCRSRWSTSRTWRTR